MDEAPAAVSPATSATSSPPIPPGEGIRAVTDVIWIGIDAGKKSHHATAVDATGKRLWSIKVTTGQQRIEELIHRAAKTGDQVRWAVDLVSPAAALLLAILLTNGQKVVYVPGRVVHGMSGVLHGEGKPTPRTRGSSPTPPGCAAT
jgi:hypothetical protein